MNCSVSRPLWLPPVAVAVVVGKCLWSVMIHSCLSANCQRGKKAKDHYEVLLLLTATVINHAGVFFFLSCLYIIGCNSGVVVAAEVEEQKLEEGTEVK